MNLRDFIEVLEKAASKYFLKPQILAKTDNAVNAGIEISDNIYVQFYFHQIFETNACKQAVQELASASHERSAMNIFLLSQHYR